MSTLGAIVRTRPESTASVRSRLSRIPGVDIAGDPADGRLILVIEDCSQRSAAGTLGEIGTWTEVINASLVFEYAVARKALSGATGLGARHDWRDSLFGLPEMPCAANW